MNRVCICLPRQLAQLGEAVVSKCSDAVSQKVKFTQCDVDDPELVSNLKQSDVLLASPIAIHKNLADLTNVKWVHSYWAGIDELISYSPSFLLTRHAGTCYGQLMSEYIVAQMVNWERQMYGFHADQLNSQWNQQRRLAVTDPRMLSTLTIGILGVGTIGSKIAEVCKAFGMTVWGLTRTKSSSPSPHVDQYRLMDGLQELLGECDYVCSILPSTPQTKGLLNGDILRSCANKKSILINVGRGDLVSEQTIVKAIEEGWLGGAILDVFEEEPLPTNSKLWGMSQVVLTPHTSALANIDDMAGVFVKNLELYVQGKELNYIVDWSRGY